MCLVYSYCWREIKSRVHCLIFDSCFAVLHLWNGNCLDLFQIKFQWLYRISAWKNSTEPLDLLCSGFCFSPSLQDFWNLILQHQSATFNNPKEKKYVFFLKTQWHYVTCEGWNVRKLHLSRTCFFCMCHAIKFQITEGKFKVTNKIFSPFPLSAFKQDLMGGKNG